MYRYTLFDTPIISHVFRLLALIGLKLTGWKAEGSKPEGVNKFVLIAAPHTSNWDFPVTLAIAFALNIKIYWMGKDSLFKGPMGPIMRWLGGIAVDRSKPGGLVASTVDTFNAAERLIVTIPPEGTRKKVTTWKTGFYHIAHGAGVPVVLGYLDFTEKRGGLGPAFYTTGDLEADMTRIKAFYAPIRGKRPDQFHPES